MDKRVFHGHQCPQDDNGSIDWSFCAWCETSYEGRSCSLPRVLEGNALYGVRSFKAMSPQRRTLLESCAVAAKSGDAHDQYFAVAVGSFDPAAGAQLRSELPGLEAADAALAAAVTEFAEVAPDAHACKKKGVAFSKKGKSREGSSRRLLGAAELAEQKVLFDEAKQTILSARRLSQK